MKLPRSICVTDLRHRSGGDGASLLPTWSEALLGERVARTPQRHSPLPKDFYFPSGFPTSKRARVRTSSEVEAAIARIHGVTAVRVLGDPRAREIHVVGERPAEELAAEVWLVTRRMLRGPLALDALNVVELEPA